MASIFVELGIILIVASLLGLVFRAIKQPLILAYIATGLLIAEFSDGLFAVDAYQSLAEVGIALLLFIVGLNMDLRILKEVGKTSLIAGLGQVVFTAALGYPLIRWLGFDPVASLYLAVALTFSSTVIVVKLLADKNDLDALYGKIAVGILLVQDFIAIALLILIVAFDAGKLSSQMFLPLVVKGALLFLIAYIAHAIFKKYFEVIARSQELLYIIAVAWCFLMALIAEQFGLSIEIGSFLAGIVLASLPFNIDIASKVKPLRDFFIILFFVILGTQLTFTGVSALIVPALILSLFILIGNPLVVLILMGLLGYRSRTSFLTGLIVAQISEFSLIMIALGVKLGHIQQEILGLTTIVGIITIAGSVYMITYGDRLYAWCAPFLKWCERRHVHERKLSLHAIGKQYDMLLLGYHRIGYHVLKHLQEQKIKYLVVDYNPEIIRNLMERNIPSLYGDVADDEMLQELKKYRPKVVISTIHLFEDNLLVTQAFRKANKKVIVYATAKTVPEALMLYKKGADYVIVPHLLGGEHIADLLKRKITDKKHLQKLKKKHIEHLVSLHNHHKI
ncbi:cation:proton antiporter [Candidatus Woesearchaeota archaeon]|nr:cation:proton antiporter [Candidatus Woesearchaeota archaeon]